MRKRESERSAKSNTGTRTETAQEDVWIPALCEWQCIEGPCLLKVHRLNDVAVGIEPNRDVEGFDALSKNQGKLCPKAYGLIQKLYNPHRIKWPMKRTNPEKGLGVDPKWVSISWNETLDIIAERLKKIREGDTTRLAQGGPGVAAIHSTDAWWAFFEAFGPTQLLWGGRSTRCRQNEHAFGNRIHGAFLCDSDLEYCNYRIVFGGNPQASGGSAEAVLFAKAKERGMKMVAIDPVLSITAAKADEWLPIRPCTDGAFMLAMVNVIVNELGVYDEEFLKQMTNSSYLVKPDGYFMRDKVTGKVLVWDLVDQKAKTYDDTTIKDLALEGTYKVEQIECKPAFQVLKEHVAQYTPEWASSITDIPSATIRRIAKEFVENARIGDTITIEGVPLPYRPVAIEIGRGVNGVTHSYQTILSVHILVALVGALEVPGGHGGGQLFPPRRQSKDGIIFHLDPLYAGIIAGPDGMQEVHSHPFTWPPRTHDAVEILCPLTEDYPYEEPPYKDPARLHYRMDHIGWRNLVDPPEGLPIPEPPEVWIRYRTNPFLSLGEPELIAEAMKRIPFIVSISYTMDEVTDYADVVLPEQIEFERYLAWFRMKPACDKKYYEIAIQQPVIEPLHNTMNPNDIFTELAARIGILSEYNMILNFVLDLDEPFKLESNRKYTWVEVVDRQFKSYTKGAYDLEWFKKNGALLRPVPVEDQYGMHLGMRAKKLRYPVPYMEQVKRTGEELARNLAEVGIEWWPTDEYVSLPIYLPPILDEVSTEYDFYVMTCRGMPFSWGNNAGIPLMNEVAKHLRSETDILMNASSAKSRGIKDGDEIWVESTVGKVKRRVKLCQGIHLQCLLIANQFGQWTMPVAKDTGRVTQTTLVPISYRWSDSVTGNQQGTVVKAKVYKA